MENQNQAQQEILLEREEDQDEKEVLSQRFSLTPSQDLDVGFQGEQEFELVGLDSQPGISQRKYSYSERREQDGERSNEELDEKDDDDDDDVSTQCIAQKMINSCDSSQLYSARTTTDQHISILGMFCKDAPMCFTSDKEFTVDELAGQLGNKESLYYLSVHKAGLQNVDKNKVHSIIKEASKHSEFYKQEEAKLQEVKEKVTRYRSKAEQARKNVVMWEKLQTEVKGKIEQLKKERFTSRTWIHVDMDAFYAAVEIRDDPSLKEIPVAVGDKNMIMTANYMARTYGVRSGVPGFIGKKLCPELKFIKPNYSKYRTASEEFKKILREYDPELESIGLDEAQLDITAYLQEHDLDTREGRQLVASEIRRKIFEATKMTASCGIACNKMLAKICSDLDKPNGQTYLTNTDEEIMRFMKELPVRKLPGVGKVNEQILAGMGITSCQDAYEKAIDIFINFTENAFDFLLKSSLGIAKAIHEDQGIKKSLNVSQTFTTLTTYQDILVKLEELCGEMEERCIQQKLSGRTLTLEFKNERFKNKQKSYTQLQYIQSKRELFNVAKSLLEQAWPLDPLRQISVKLLNLKDDTGKMSYSTTEVMINTKGKSKLGGNHKECNLPVRQTEHGIVTTTDTGILHHKLPSMYNEEEFYEQQKRYNRNQNFKSIKPGYGFPPFRYKSGGYNGYYNQQKYNNNYSNSYGGYKNKDRKKREEGEAITEVQESPYNEKYRSGWIPKEQIRDEESKKGFQSSNKPYHDYNEMKAYRNFYKNNKLYISKYKQMLESEKKKNKEVDNQKKPAQKNITSFIGKTQLVT